jgi:hypothetical protein
MAVINPCVPYRRNHHRAPRTIARRRPSLLQAASQSATAALSLASEKYAGGGILLLVDEFSDEEAEFVEFEALAAERRDFLTGQLRTATRLLALCLVPILYWTRMRLRQILRSHLKYVEFFLSNGSEIFN